jgi:hypothetical protein
VPPQPVLTMIDHLMNNGVDVEGILRKSPKQATVRILKTQLDQGQVPNFNEFNIHVTASLLKVQKFCNTSEAFQDSFFYPEITIYGWKLLTSKILRRKRKCAKIY